MDDEKNADYAYWHQKGWLDDHKQYYVDVRVGLLKRLFAGFIVKIARKLFKNMFADGSELVFKKYRKLESLQFS